MIPKFKKPGEKVTIVCPACDGTGKNVSNEEENCPDCKGSGKMEGIVSAR
jgi:DnaJ-class molecular chaperone